MNITYNKQPTILIGLGGFASHIVDNIYAQVKETHHIEAYAIDTDRSCPMTLNSIPKNNFICTSVPISINELLMLIPKACEWFPRHPLLMAKALCDGAGQVRAISRLGFENTLLSGGFKNLLDDAYNMAKKCTDSLCPMRISVVTSLVGGTGSGIFIQIALLLRNHIAKHFPTLNLKIHGEFIMPANFVFLPAFIENRNMEANTYASLKELNVINNHFFNNTPSIELTHELKSEDDTVNSLPYDYCFLYDRINNGTRFDGEYIETSITERLFLESANILNDIFVKNLRTSLRKRAGNLYGKIHSEKLSNGSSLLQSEIYRSIINRNGDSNNKQIFMVTAPRSLRVDSAQLPQNTEFIELINPVFTETVITVMEYGIELSQIDKLRYGTGLYYKSYKALTERLPQVITPHLDVKWHNTIADIGENSETNITLPKTENSLPEITSHNKQPIPNDNFVFISYSTKETSIADHTRNVLKTNGINCWMAPQSIPAGSDYASEIPKAIDECKAFLLLLSKSSQESNWVPKEVGLAIGKGKIIVPFQIDDSNITDAFNFYLTNSQRISAFDRMAEAYQELTKRLFDILKE